MWSVGWISRLTGGVCLCDAPPQRPFIGSSAVVRSGGHFAVDCRRCHSANSSNYTSGYFLNAIDMRKTVSGPEFQPEEKQVLILLFKRTLVMSLIIMGTCILLGYPVAWLLANLPARQANLLMILVWSRYIVQKLVLSAVVTRYFYI